MAAYFTGGGAGTDVQAGGADGLQMLYLMNPNYVGYTDVAAPAAANMMLLNSAVRSLTPTSFGHHQPTPAEQHFVGIPLQPSHSGYNLWAPATTTTTTCAAVDMSPRQEGAPGTSVVSAVLSLSSREAPPVTVAAVPGTDGRYEGASPATTPSQQEQALMRSRYLKAAQELLDEAVRVSKGVEEANATKNAAEVKKKEASEGVSGGGAEDGGAGSKSGGVAEMSTAKRQEHQMKKCKLVNMLDEVEQRYRQYHQQMQAVAASFEAVAGPGSARTYNRLALRTISRQFRCLRHAIATQVRSTSQALGEDVNAEGGRAVGSRLQFIDHQLRQHCALQQLGMAQGGGAWRPQRGLPERSVSVLRAWLFEHFLHPYPKDSDKIMLAKQTGLTRSQVSNWFINARVKLWKPMVEEMYLEETKGKDDRPGAAAGGDDDDDSGDGGRMSNNNNTDSARHENSVSSTSAPGTTSTVDHVHASASGLGGPLRPGDQHSQASFYGGGGGDGNDGASFQHRLKKARTTTDESTAFRVSDVAALQAQAAAAARRDEVSHRELLMKFMEAGGTGQRGHNQDDDGGGYSLFTPAPYGQFGSAEHFAFAGSGGGGVSLTLGLPHCAAAEQTDSFIMGGSNASDGVSAAGYDMNMQNTKSLAAQLMGNFVA